MKTLNIGLVGLGARGSVHYHNLKQREEVRLRAIADIALHREHNSTGEGIAADISIYEGPSAYRCMCEAEQLDAVIVSVPWQNCMEVVQYFLQQDVHVGIEPTSVAFVTDCKVLLQAWKSSKAEVMLLENVCYRRDIMAIRNMAETGLLGKIVHCRAGYEHDLRQVLFTPPSDKRWRLEYSKNHNADLYPTHALGPLAKLLGINRGNYFKSIYSVATSANGLNDYAQEQGEDETKGSYALGDIITSIIKTRNDETIVITHDTSLPRPYSLGFRVQGTKGIWINEASNKIYLENMEAKEWQNAEALLKKYDSPLWQAHESAAAQAYKHEMDYFVLKEFIDSIREKRSPEIDIYDFISWSLITPLSEQSIREGRAIDFPEDFEHPTSRELFARQEHSLS